MKTVACLYCEGNDTKFVVIQQEKSSSKIKVLSASSIGVTSSGSVLESNDVFSSKQEDVFFEERDTQSSVSFDESDISSMSSFGAALSGQNLSKLVFIPALTEPSMNYHSIETKEGLKGGKLFDELISDIKLHKGVDVKKDSMDFIDLSENSYLAAFVDGPIGCVNLAKGIAEHLGKKHFRIPTIKSADIALAYYVAKRKKFFPDDKSLIVYIGKDYSKLIFLQGKKLKYLGATQDMGTTNIRSYDVYFSKILLEMENGGIPSLDNIIVCGEDDSENLILSFYGTFPEANVSRLEFDDVDLSSLEEEAKSKFSSFCVPISVITEYFDEAAKEHKGINLLPKYISEEQKLFQFSWHSFLVLPLIFLVAFLFTIKMLQNNEELAKLDKQIAEKNKIISQNRLTLDKIAELKGRIGGFDQTVTILDSAAVGTKMWINILKDVSEYYGIEKDIWITQLSNDNNSISMNGYSVSKYSPADVSYNLKGAVLNNLTNETLREEKIFQYDLKFNISSYRYIK